MEKQVFSQFDGRVQHHFHNKHTMMEQVDRKNMITWIEKLLEQMNLTGNMEDENEDQDDSSSDQNEDS